jgi:hypothetical protein
MLDHQVEPAAHQDGPLARRFLAPVDLRPFGRFDGPPGLLTAAPRNLGDRLPRGRICDGKGPAAVGVDPLTVDVGAGLDKGAVGELHAVTSRMAFL